jgi:hypothetical protein
MRTLEVAFTGRPDVLQPAVTQMFRLKYAAVDLLRVPLPGTSGLHAGPTFEYVPKKSQREEPPMEAATATVAKLPPVVNKAEDVPPFYYGSHNIIEVLYRVNPANVAPYLQGSGLQAATFSDGGTLAGFMFQLYTSQFNNGTEGTTEIELNAIALPQGRPIPQMTAHEWAMGLDQSKVIGNQHIWVPCDDPVAIQAGIQKYDEPKFLTQFVTDVPSVNVDPAQDWNWICLAPGFTPSKDPKINQQNSIFYCNVSTKGLTPGMSNATPITEFGKVTAAGPDKGKLIACRWDFPYPWPTWFLGSSDAGRVKIGYGNSTHPMQAAMKAMLAGGTPFVVRSNTSPPSAIETRTYYP